MENKNKQNEEVQGTVIEEKGVKTISLTIEQIEECSKDEKLRQALRTSMETAIKGTTGSTIFSIAKAVAKQLSLL